MRWDDAKLCVMFAGVRAWATAACVILIWGITFVNTRALLGEFSALEILVGRFALAWAALWGWELWKRCGDRNVAAPVGGGSGTRGRVWRDEGMFTAMGFCGIFCYQFLGERLTRMSLLGGGFIVIGVAIANWRWRR